MVSCVIVQHKKVEDWQHNLGVYILLAWFS